MDVYTQILPIIIMVFTLMIVRKNVDFNQIPGFDKLSGLFLAISAVLAMMWILDKTHIIAFTFMPFYWVIILLIGIFILLRFGLKRFFA